MQERRKNPTSLLFDFCTEVFALEVYYWREEMANSVSLFLG